ncbi:MAG TPA: hypothetical protein VH012_03755 [Acidimicrobiales bacterium]|nr:hypothetical protein [Acidimicrobiales bacterium]
MTRTIGNCRISRTALTVSALVASLSCLIVVGAGPAEGSGADNASVTAGCLRNARGPAIVVTVYGAPVGNVIGHETIVGPKPTSGDGATNREFAASQFHPGQPVPMSLVEAQGNETYTVTFHWSDGSSPNHSLGPITIKTPDCVPSASFDDPDPYPQLSYINMVPTADGDGYYLLSGTGLVNAFDDGTSYGDTYDAYDNLSNTLLNAPVVGIASGPTSYFGGTEGYWIATADGGVFSFGGFTPFYGSAGSLSLNSPIVGIASTHAGNGYWLVAADGGIFDYGSAHFYGSTGSIKLNSPIVGIAPTPDDGGYYLVAADGGIFAFGDARFQGSMGGAHVNQPIIGMGVDEATGGYWLAAADGGIFAYDAPFDGSTGSIQLNRPIVSFAPTPTGNGYWFMGSDGGMFSYGDAQYLGSGVPS